MGKKKKVIKRPKKEIEEKVETPTGKLPIPDGVLKTELGYQVVLGGDVIQTYEGAESFKTAVRDYGIRIGA